jgi:hypothetical protein
MVQILQRIHLPPWVIEKSRKRSLNCWSCCRCHRLDPSSIPLADGKSLLIFWLSPRRSLQTSSHCEPHPRPKNAVQTSNSQRRLMARPPKGAIGCHDPRRCLACRAPQSKTDLHRASSQALPLKPCELELTAGGEKAQPASNGYGGARLASTMRAGLRRKDVSQSLAFHCDSGRLLGASTTPSKPARSTGWLHIAGRATSHS